KDFRASGLRVRSAAENGGGDFRGNVVEYFRRELKNGQTAHRILTCGPEKMMEAVYSLAVEFKIPLEASLEAKMGCALGVCLSCVATKHNTLLCQEGPILR